MYFQFVFTPTSLYFKKGWAFDTDVVYFLEESLNHIIKIVTGKTALLEM